MIPRMKAGYYITKKYILIVNSCTDTDTHFKTIGLDVEQATLSCVLSSSVRNEETWKEGAGRDLDTFVFGDFAKR